MANPSRTIFIISDGTGITVEHVVHTLATQFDEMCCDTVVRPFVNDHDKIDAVKRELGRAAERDGARPVVFASIVDEELRALLRSTDTHFFDLFDTFLPPLSAAIGIAYSDHIGLSHSIGNPEQYDRRVDAVNFALNYDDGSRYKGLENADLILIGVSRCGKTPTCLYLAMQYTVRAANFPLTEDDFMLGRLPEPLRPHRDRLFGLTIAPERLHRIREERRPGSNYASLAQCRSEVAAAEGVYLSEGIRYLDSTSVSIEELAIEIMQQVGVERHY